MTAPKQDPLIVNKFLGLVNTFDPLQAPKGSLLVADNIDIDDSDSIHRRNGYTTATSFVDIYATFATEDQQKLYVIDDGDLLSVENDFTKLLLATDFPAGVYEWEEAGPKVYLMGPVNGVIDNGVFKPWGVPTSLQPSCVAVGGSLPKGQYQISCVHRNVFGEEGGAPSPFVISLVDSQALEITIPQIADHTTDVYISATNGETLYKAITTSDVYYLFDGDLSSLVVPLSREQYQRYQVPATATELTYADSRMYVADYDQSNNITYIFHSEPFWLGLFDLFGKYEAIPGKVNMLEAYAGGLVIGTDKEIFSYSVEGGLNRLADYGVPEGKQASKDPTGTLFFWTDRGVCKVPDFVNLTQERVSVPSGSKCTTAFIEQQGYNKFLVTTTDSGSPNNKYK